MADTFEPIIQIPKKKSSLKKKTVAVQGNLDFSRSFIEQTPKENNNTPQEPKEEKKIDPILFKATLTQKISPAVHLKINTLRAFLDEEDEIIKTTTNDIISFLIDSHVNAQFTSRQKAAFFSIYNTQLELKSKK